MTEPRGEYQPDNIFRCPACKATIGELVTVEIDGKQVIMLKRKGLLIEWMPRAYCECGQFIVFSATSRKLSNLIRGLRPIGS